VSTRALSFGPVAPAYERFRPGYPGEVADQVLAYAGRPVRTALEVGAGTGKATRVFASRGVAVTATDPDPAMLTELRKHVPDTVTVVRGSFEELPLTPVYDLVFAAASFHWTQPEGRWDRVAAMLRPDGIFASFGSPLQLADPAVEQAVRAARAEFLVEDGVPSPDGTPPESTMQWPGSELLLSRRFADVRQLVIERPLDVSSSDYVGNLATVSAYLELPQTVRAQVLARILSAVPERVALVADIILHVARLAD
jgi:SAM-dependent methyltransferase